MLEAQAGDKLKASWTDVWYRENVNADAIDGDKWLDNHTSYIWKVGVLLLADSNKADWFDAYIGVLRGNESYHEPEFIGHLHFPHGEADDVGRLLDRAFTLLEFMHPAFDKQ